MSFAQRDPHCVAIDEQCSRADDRLSFGGLPVLRWLLAAGACDRINEPSFQIDATDSMIANVGDIQTAAMI